MAAAARGRAADRPADCLRAGGGTCAGLIHRDIKPANVWLESNHDYRVKVLDFGLARVVVEDVQVTGSRFVGTPSYAAPEQARGERVDFRCDLFSLGIVLYQLCTGTLPFRGNSLMAILTRWPLRIRLAEIAEPGNPTGVERPYSAADGEESCRQAGVGSGRR